MQKSSMAVQLNSLPWSAQVAHLLDLALLPLYSTALTALIRSSRTALVAELSACWLEPLALHAAFLFPLIDRPWRPPLQNSEGVTEAIEILEFNMAE